MFQQYLYHHSHILSPSALLFPAVDPRRRYLIHSTVQDYFPTLTTLSVGQGDARRTAVTFINNPSHPPTPPPTPPLAHAKSTTNPQNSQLQKPIPQVKTVPDPQSVVPQSTSPHKRSSETTPGTSLSTSSSSSRDQSAGSPPVEVNSESSRSIPIVSRVFENRAKYSAQSNPAVKGNTNSSAARNTTASKGSTPSQPLNSDRSKTEPRREDRRRGSNEQKQQGTQQVERKGVHNQGTHNRQYPEPHRQSQDHHKKHQEQHRQYIEYHRSDTEHQNTARPREPHSTPRHQEKPAETQQQNDKYPRREEWTQQQQRSRRSRSSSSSQSVPRLQNNTDEYLHTTDEAQSKKKRNHRKNNKRHKDRPEPESRNHRNEADPRPTPGTEKDKSDRYQNESFLPKRTGPGYSGSLNEWTNREAGNSEWKTSCEEGRRKKLKSTGEEEEANRYRRSWRPSQDYDPRACVGRVPSQCEEDWSHEYPNTTGHQRMPVTTMPPDTTTTNNNNNNNRRRGKAAAQIYRPPPARSTREELTCTTPQQQQQRQPTHHDNHRQSYQHEAHRNNYLQDLQRNSFLQDPVRSGDTQRHGYQQDTQRNSYQQESHRNNYQQDSHRNNYHQDYSGYYQEVHHPGRQRTDSESSNMAGDGKLGRGRRPDQVLYVPRGRRGRGGPQEPGSARATPTPMQDYVDMARPPSPAFSVCSVASEYSGRNRYNRSRQGSQASIYDADLDKVKGKPPMSNGENGKDTNQVSNKGKGNGRFPSQTMQLIERCLNHDSDPSNSEKWEKDLMNYNTSSPKNRLGGHSGGERVQKSPTPTRDIHSIHSKENVINPVEPGKKSRKRRNRRRNSHSREPSADKYNDMGPSSSGMGDSNNRDQHSNGYGDKGFGSSEHIFYSSNQERYDRGYDNYDRYSSINNSRASSRNSSRERTPQQNPNGSWRGGSNVSSPGKGSVNNNNNRGSQGKPPSGRLGSLPNVALDFGDAPRKYSNEERYHTLPFQHHKSPESQRNVNHMKNDEYGYECNVPDRSNQRTMCGRDQRYSDKMVHSVTEIVNEDCYGNSDNRSNDHISNRNSHSSEALNSVASRIGNMSVEEDNQPQISFSGDGMDESMISNQSGVDSLEDVDSNLDSSVVGSIHSEELSEASHQPTNETIAEEENVCDITIDASAPDLLSQDSSAPELPSQDSSPKEIAQELTEQEMLYENGLILDQSGQEELDTDAEDKEEKKGSKKFSFNWADEVDDSWDSLYDDTGECLDPDIKQQLSESIGKVKLEKPTNDYYSYQPKEPEINEEEYAHVIEIYDFPGSFKTQDLMMVFNDFQKTGFDIKWVDDTHALGIFATALVAADALSFDHPFIKTRSLASATKPSKAKAMRITDALLPYKARPATSATLARRLVSGALGLRVNISREVREAEKQKLKEAKARKRLVAKQRNDAWEGTLT